MSCPINQQNATPLPWINICNVTLTSNRDTGISFIPTMPPKRLIVSPCNFGWSGTITLELHIFKRTKQQPFHKANQVFLCETLTDLIMAVTQHKSQSLWPLAHLNATIPSYVLIKMSAYYHWLFLFCISYNLGLHFWYVWNENKLKLITKQCFVCQGQVPHQEDSGWQRGCHAFAGWVATAAGGEFHPFQYIDMHVHFIYSWGCAIWWYKFLAFISSGCVWTL